MRHLASRLSYRTLGVLGVIAFALAGAVAAYLIPFAMPSADAWFTMHDGADDGLLLGLLLAFTGVTTIRAFATPKDRSHRR